MPFGSFSGSEFARGRVIALVVAALLLLPGTLLLYPVLGEVDAPHAWLAFELLKDGGLFAIAAVAFFRLGGARARDARRDTARPALAALEDLGDGLAVFDSEDRLVFANDAFRDRFDGTPPSTRGRILEVLMASARPGPAPFIRRGEAGSVMILPLPMGEGESFVDRRPATEGLAHLVGSIPLAAIAIDRHDGTVREANPEAARMLGLSGPTPRVLATVFDDPAPRRLLEAIDAEGSARDMDARLADGGGAVRVDARLVGTGDDRGAIIAILRPEPAESGGGAGLPPSAPDRLSTLAAGLGVEVLEIDRAGAILGRGGRALDLAAEDERPALLNALARAAATEEAVVFDTGAPDAARRLRILPLKGGGQVERLLLVVAARPAEAGDERPADAFFEASLPQFILDSRGGRIVAANAAARILYGLDGAAPPPGTFSAIDPDSVAPLAPLFADPPMLAEAVYRATHASAGGGVREVEVHARIVGEAAERRIHLSVVDITDLKHAADALRESEARFRAVFEHGPGGIAVLDLDGHVLRANPALQDMLGYSVEALRPILFAELAHPDDQAGIAHRLAATVSGAVIPETAEVRIIRRDGHVLWVQFSTALQRDERGRPQFVIVMMSDIGERKAVEQALRMSEERLRAIIDNSPAVITVMDRQGRHLLVNARFVDLTGLGEAEVRGRTAFDYLPADSAEAAVADTRTAVESGVPVTREERLRLGRDERLFMTVRFPLFTPDGAIYGACAIATDVTEHRKIEESLRQAQKMEAIGQLTGGVAHDFNNLLTVVQGNLEWLAERLAGDRTGLSLAESALESARLGSSLTQRLLAFSRKQPLRPEVVDLPAVLGRIEPLLLRTLGETIRLETRVTAGLGRVRLDPQQFENSLLNLVLNARDAMAGGGTLTIALDNDVIPPETAAGRGVTAGDCVRITVADTGVGMSPEVIQRAFEPFFTTKEKGKGTGLGLSMVYGFVRQSGGLVDIESARGGGTRIIIRLPRVEGEAREAPKPTAGDPETLPRGTESVLVVEDDPRVRKLAVGILEWLGYAVLEADDGPSAVELLEDNDDIEIVFSDVVMPGGLSGFEVAARARELYPAIRVLFMSGYSHEEMGRVGIVPGQIELLPKPFTRRDLAIKIRAVLDAPPPS